MASIIIMPKLGLTMTEGTIGAWHKKVGDAVTAGEPLFDVETDKLTNTIESTASGTLLKIIVDVGGTVPYSEPVGIVGEPGEDVGSLTSGAVAAPAAEEAKAGDAPAPVKRAEGERVVASPRAKKLAQEMGIDIALVSGTGPNGRITEDDVKNYKPAAAPAPEEDKIKATPLVKKVAADLGIDLKEVPAKGRILAEDLLTYMQGTREKTDGVTEREEVVPMNSMRKAIAKNMLNSHMTSPTVTANLSVDMSAMKQYREQLKAKEIKVSYTDLLVKFVAKALTEYPLLNCSVEDNKIIYKHYVNMGVAVALDNGLVVPNVVDADKKSLTEISAEIKELATLAREGGLPMEKLKGGTFTITNLGMYGVESFTPIINQPEVAILGVTTMEDRAVVRNGEIVIRPMMTLSLTFDHRVVDGSVAAEFLQRVKNLLENPALILA